MKKLITALIITCIICTSTLTITNASPDTDASKAQFVEVSDKLKNLNAELVETNKEINNLEITISNNENSIAEHQKQIQNAESKISSLKDEISENENILSERLREMYKNNGFTAVNYISFLFESASLSDLIDRVTACNLIIKEDNKLINSLNNKVTEQNNSKDLISTKKAELESLNNENKNKLSEVNTKKASQVEVQKQLQDEQAKLSETITNNEIALISSDISTIDTSTNRTQINNAVIDIQAKLPQFTMPGAINKANEYINKGKEKIKSMPEDGGSTISYADYPSQDRIAKILTIETTAYAGDGITSTGSKPVRIPSGISTVAVDPTLIPYGTLVYIPDYGYAAATDCGGDIKGLRMDLFMNSEGDCKSWGRRKKEVCILKY